MCNLEINRVRPQMIVDPAREDGGFEGSGPGLWKRFQPVVQLLPRGIHRAFPVHLAIRPFDTECDGLLVNIQPDVVHIALKSLLGFDSESASPLSSAFVHQVGSSLLYIQTDLFFAA